MKIFFKYCTVILVINKVTVCSWALALPLVCSWALALPLVCSWALALPLVCSWAFGRRAGASATNFWKKGWSLCYELLLIRLIILLLVYFFLI